MGLRLSVGLLEDYKNKHKMIMLIGALSSGCVSLFRIIFNNGIVFLIENLFSGLARAMGFFQAVYALGMTLFPMICGNIVSHFSMLYAYLFLAVICFIAASISFIYCKSH